ncbi:MAG: hypothetical protein EBS90_08590 [Betaproteobacteria bacterium]|jgi:hypothetical protein|nr:hypothetical protein [Betaproteobacteria bacterium]
MASKNNTVSQNKNASIRTREDRRGRLRTETFRRDENSVNVSVSTDPKNDSTMLFINTSEGSTFRFDGRTARTLYRTLQKHYQAANKSY